MGRNIPRVFQLKREYMCLGDCDYRDYGKKGEKICSVIEAEMDGTKMCPKLNPNMRFCDKHQTFCDVRVHCETCDLENSYEEVLGLYELFEELRNENGGYHRR